MPSAKQKKKYYRIQSAERRAEAYRMGGKDREPGNRKRESALPYRSHSFNDQRTMNNELAQRWVCIALDQRSAETAQCSVPPIVDACSR